MPELPEVEVIRRGLAPRFRNRRLLGLTLGTRPLRRASSAEELHHWLVGRSLKDIRRRGKYLLFLFEGGVTLLIHLGMTGRLLPNAALEPESHVHAIFHFEGGETLVYQDVRRFGQILVYPPGVFPDPLARVGREPFSPHLDPGWLQEQARGRRRPVKNFLLEGRTVAGLGNIYASEILHAAGIHPETPAGELDLAQWARILRETRRILKEAIRLGGTTVNDYLDSRGETGLFQLALRVYGRAGEPCRACGTPIERLVQAGRSTFFCPRCQPRQGL